MYKEIAGLVLYRDLGEESILYKLADIFRDWKEKQCGKEELVSRIYQQIKRILDISTSYGFNKNLWRDYLSFILVTNENSEASSSCLRAIIEFSKAFLTMIFLL